MPYRTLPAEGYHRLENPDVSRAGCYANTLIVMAGTGLGFVIVLGLSVFLAQGQVDHSEPGAGIALLLGTLLLVVVLPLIVKAALLILFGGKVCFGWVSLWGKMPRTYRHFNSLRFFDVYAPNMYLTSAEFLRINLLPQVIHLAVIAALLAFGPVETRVAAAFGLGLKLSIVFFRGIYIADALRRPPCTLFAELDAGVLDIFVPSGPT